MAWCSRTSRKHHPPGTGQSATAAIGPGSYNTIGSSVKPPKPSFAAFGSSGLKDAYPDLPLHTPGPGAYATTISTSSWTPASYGDATASSSMFKSSTERTKFKSASAAPGPGAYGAAAHPSAFKKSKATSTMRRSQSDAKPNSGGGVKWVRVPTAPSIPNVAQSFGYEEGPKGQMILQHPSKSGHSGCANDATGPGEYDPLQALHRLACTRATSFAKSKTSRDSKHKSTVAPGPGFYHTETHPHPHAAVPSAVFKSTLTRERAAHSMARTTAAAVPGPGSYNSSTPQKAKKTVPEHLQFFGSTTSRFEPKAPPTSSMPATTSSTPVKPQSHHHNPHNVGFASSNKRFDTTVAKDTFDVGPGSYNAPGLVEELQHRVSGRTGVFGSTTKRFESAKPLLDTVLLEHDPRSNNQHDDTMSVVKAKSSAFASATSRFQSPAAKDPVPCPGDYNINLTWDKPGGKAVFASHMDRGTALDRKTAALPGPGSYVGPDYSTMKKAKPTTQRKDVFMSTEPRFKSKLAPLANLGPGAYNPDTIETDWNRPTYNITIATEMEKRI